MVGSVLQTNKKSKLEGRRGAKKYRARKTNHMHIPYQDSESGLPNRGQGYHPHWYDENECASSEPPMPSECIAPPNPSKLHGLSLPAKLLPSLSFHLGESCEHGPILFHREANYRHGQKKCSDDSVLCLLTLSRKDLPSDSMGCFQRDSLLGGFASLIWNFLSVASKVMVLDMAVER